MIRKALAVTVLSAAIVTGGAGVASARPVLDPAQADYCGPGQILVNGSCARTELAPDPLDDGGFFAALGASWMIAFLLG